MPVSVPFTGCWRLSAPLMDPRRKEESLRPTAWRAPLLSETKRLLAAGQTRLSPPLRYVFLSA